MASNWRKLMFPWLRDRQIIAENRLSAIDLGLNIPGKAVAVGYFFAGRDSERNLDIFILSEDKKLITVHSWDVNGDRYVPTDATAYAEKGHEIVSVSVSDFNHDGYLDLLISQRTTDNGPLNHRIFFGDGQSFKISGWNIPSSLDDFLLLDFHGRMLVDLLAVPSLTNFNDNELEVWSAQADDPLALVNGFFLTQTNAKFCQPIRPQSHAFADFNGDGFADLLLTCKSNDNDKNDKDFLQLWTSAPVQEEKKPSGVGLKDTDSHSQHFTRYIDPREIDLPTGHGPISLGDFNSDGSLDVIYAVCDPPQDCSRENSVHILFNTQGSYCKTPKQTDCKNLDQIMESDPKFIGFTEESRVIIKLDPKEVRVHTTHPITGQPVQIGVGDYNVDGYPDVLLIVSDVKNGVAAVDGSKVLLLENVSSNSIGGRTLVKLTQGAEGLNDVKHVTSGSFINFYQDGPPDILLNYLKIQGKDKNGLDLYSPSVQTIQNGFVQDAFFLRVETLNAVCPAPCMTRPTGSQAHRPYGASFPGPTMKFSFTDFDGSLKIRTGSQLPQSGYNRLTTPFTFFGLGRTNNFVELLTVRTPSRNPHLPNLAKKAGLIPNSDLIINPPHADSIGSFHFELHIIPGKYFLWVLISIATAMFVLGSLTAFFKWKEIKEDNEERRKALHSINFDAL